MLQQPRGRPVEQHAGPLGAGPRPRGQPGAHLDLDLRVAELPVAVDLADLAGVLVLGRQPGRVLLHTRRVGDPELAGEVLDHRPRHVQRVSQEGAEEPRRGELDGEPEPIVVTAALADQSVVALVEEEVAVQLRLRRHACVAAVAADLLVGEELNRHQHPSCSCITWWHWRDCLRN